MGKWLAQFKEISISETPTQGTDKADNAQVALNSDQPLTLAGADPDEEARASEQLRHRGYFLMHSRALGERIAIVETEAGRRQVPQGLPVYTFQEIRLLQQGVEASRIVTIADLRALHETKKLGGVITR
jgi:hypothetical protein